MPLRLCLLAYVLIVLTGCGLFDQRPLGVHQFELGNEEGGQKVWSASTARLPGKLILHTRQQANNEWKLQFREYPSQTVHYPLQVTVSDRDCDVGHKVMIEYYPERRTSYIEYLETIIPWGEELRLSVIWNSDNNFTVSVNDAYFSGTFYDNFSAFSVVSHHGRQDIHLEYIASEGDQGTSQP